MPTEKPRRPRPLTPGSRAHDIAARLEAEIIAGKRRPRERIVELDVAAEFGVSRAPVREALRLLEREGLVSTGPRGVHVTDITAQEVADIFEILAHLEQLYTERATPFVSAAMVDAARRVLDEMAAAAAVNDVHRYFELNIEFHHSIREACPNRRLIALLESLGKQTLRYRHLAMSLPGRMPVSLEEHRRIVDALAARDAKAAGRYARESAQAAFEALTQFLRQNPLLV